MTTDLDEALRTAGADLRLDRPVTAVLDRGDRLRRRRHGTRAGVAAAVLVAAGAGTAAVAVLSGGAPPETGQLLVPTSPVASGTSVPVEPTPGELGAGQTFRPTVVSSARATFRVSDDVARLVLHVGGVDVEAQVRDGAASARLPDDLQLPDLLAAGVTTYAADGSVLQDAPAF